MSFRRPRLRSRKHTVDIHLDDQPCSVWLPSPDDALIIAQFSDASNLAMSVLDMPVENEALVLLDDSRRVTAIFADPPTALGLFVGWYDGPGLEVPFSHTMSICLAHDVPHTPPFADRYGYYELRRIHLLQGLHLLDVLLVSHERVSSLAIACDPDAVWFEHFAPLEAS